MHLSNKTMELMPLMKGKVIIRHFVEMTVLSKVLRDVNVRIDHPLPKRDKIAAAIAQRLKYLSWNCK